MKPDPADYDDYNDFVEALADYKADLAIKRAKEATAEAEVDRIAQGVTEGMTAWTEVNRPRPQPHQLPLDHRVLLQGNGKDKEHYRLVMDKRNELIKLRQDIDNGKIKDVVAYSKLADSLEKDLQELRRSHEYSFLKKEREDNLEWGQARAEEMLSWSPEKIRENIVEVESILQGLRDQSDGEQSYLLDVGSPFKSDHDPTYKIVRVTHPGIKSRDLSAVDGKKDNQSLLNQAVRKGWSMQLAGEDEDAQGDTLPVDEDGFTSQAEYEKWRMQNGAKSF